MIISELVYKITGDTKAAEASLAKTDKAANKSAFSISKYKVAALAAAAAVVGLGVALGKMVSRQLKVIDAEAKMADRLGVSMEAMAGLNQIAGLTGVSSESLGKAIQGLDRRIGEAEIGVGRAGESISALGLSIDTLKSEEPEEAFFQLAESLQQVEDRTEQARLANDLFGRSGQELLGVIRSSGSSLRSMSDEAKELGMAISRNAAAEVEKFNDNLFRLSQRSEGIKRQFTVTLMPSLNRLGTAFLDASKDGGWFSSAMQILSGWISNVIDGIAYLVEEVNLLSGSASKVATLEREVEVLSDQINNAASESEFFGRRFINAVAAGSDATGQASLESEKYRKSLAAQNTERLKAAKIELEGARKTAEAEAKIRKARGTGRAGSRDTGAPKELTDLQKLQQASKEYHDSLIEQREASAIRLVALAEKQDTEIDKIYAKKQLQNIQDEKANAEQEKQNAILQKRIDILDTINSVTSAGMAVISALGQLSAAQNQAKIEALDNQMQAELMAAGLAEETQIEQAQREFDAAVAAGDLIAQEEKKRALEKAKIEEKYRKARADLEYKAAMDAYNYRVIEAAAAVPLAILSALISGWKTGPITAGIYAGMAGLAAGLQYAAVQAARPTPPAFAQGGIVPGSSFSGDNVSARVNSGEMILNQQQQGRLFEMVNGGGGGQQVIIYLGGQKVYDELHRASVNGNLLIDARAVT